MADEEAKKLLDAQTHIWNHIFCYFNSMALKCAVQLGIPDTIQRHGKPMTLDELATSLSLHPNKAPSLYRLMRLLVQSKFFSNQKLSSGDEVFDLTINSQLLLKDHPLTLHPFALAMLDPGLVEPTYHLSTWLRNDEESPFHVAHGRNFWEYVVGEPRFNDLFHQALAMDAPFVMSVLANNNEFKGLFEGIELLIDVGGGNGSMAKAIISLFPRVKCMVFDLPHVIEGLKGDESNLVYIGGDMFNAIPPTQAILLKWILHDWSDEDCIKILQRCKEAIPNKEQGGKVIIIDMVVETNNANSNYSNAQIFFDMEMLIAFAVGKERTEEEWKQLFNSAGFYDYKIFSLLGPRSIIEIYPS